MLKRRTATCCFALWCIRNNFRTHKRPGEDVKRVIRKLCGFGGSTWRHQDHAWHGGNSQQLAQGLFPAALSVCRACLKTLSAEISRSRHTEFLCRACWQVKLRTAGSSGTGTATLDHVTAACSGALCPWPRCASPCLVSSPRHASYNFEGFEVQCTLASWPRACCKLSTRTVTAVDGACWDGCAPKHTSQYTLFRRICRLVYATSLHELSPPQGELSFCSPRGKETTESTGTLDSGSKPDLYSVLQRVQVVVIQPTSHQPAFWNPETAQGSGIVCQALHRSLLNFPA